MSIILLQTVVHVIQSAIEIFIMYFVFDNPISTDNFWTFAATMMLIGYQGMFAGKLRNSLRSVFASLRQRFTGVVVSVVPFGYGSSYETPDAFTRLREFSNIVDQNWLVVSQTRVQYGFPVSVCPCRAQSCVVGRYFSRSAIVLLTDPY